MMIMHAPAAAAAAAAAAVDSEHPFIPPMRAQASCVQPPAQPSPVS